MYLITETTSSYRVVDVFSSLINYFRCVRDKCAIYAIVKACICLARFDVSVEDVSMDNDR